MSKKLILSLSIIGIVAAIAVGGTIAYFNDTETSTGNIFTAGSIDLTIDSTSYYNGHKCEDDHWECEPWADSVVSFNQGTKKNGGSVPLERSDPTKALGEAERNDTYNFVSLGLGIHGSIVLKFDNLILNGEGDDLEIVETSFGSPNCSSYPERAEVWVSQDGNNWDKIGEICLDATLDMNNGSLNLPWAKYVKIKDITDPNDFSSGNVDGYDLDGVQAIYCGTDPDLIGQLCDGSWNLTDLDAEKFFNFVDVKPGDSGKNVISLHVESNDAWVCATIDNMTNDDNSCIEPESHVDSTCGTGFDPNGGELAENLYFFAWSDDGDSFFEPDQGETYLFSNVIGSASDVLNGVTYPIADSGTGEFLTATTTYYIGLAWSAGDMSVNETTGNISCDGSAMGNDCQSDSVSADITFYAEQHRNNPDFVCGQY